MKFNKSTIKHAFRLRVLIFAAVLTLFAVGWDVTEAYIAEEWKISQRSVKAFGGSITPHISVGEMLKSAGYSVWSTLFGYALIVFLPTIALFALIKSLVINEPRAGWRRLSIALPVVIAIAVVLNFAFRTSRFRLDDLIIAGLLTTCFTLVFVWMIRWVVSGFANQNSDTPI